MRWLKQERGLVFADYDALWQWSVEQIDAFWLALWQWADIPTPQAPRVALADACMPGATWFPGVQMNYVQQVFRHATTERPAIVHRNESGETGEMSWAELQRQVASVAATLRGVGVGRADRVAAFLPNTPQAIIAFLAVASIGAVWSACAPDMGELAVLDRFRQIEPKVLIAVDGYRYGGKAFDRRPLLQTLLEQLPSVERVILDFGLPEANTFGSNMRGAMTWAEAISLNVPLLPELVPFDHPLWIVYSSGTTGLPKPIVHSQGGIVLEHVKLTTLHLDLSPGDRFYWQASTGWIMWNLSILDHPIWESAAACKRCGQRPRMCQVARMT